MKKILIIDDDIAVTNYLMVFLMQTETYESTVINDSRDVPALLEREEFDAILLDMDMPHLSGLDILKITDQKKIETPVIILTGVNNVDLAVKSLKLGAFDYLTKPVDDDYLLEVIGKAIQQNTLHTRILQLPKHLKREDLVNVEAFEHVPTKSPEMIHLFHQVEKMAAGDLSIFIIGERGTGKNSLAKAIHDASPRADKPFIAIDVATRDGENLAAELFGQAPDWRGQKEATPGFLEAAESGTLFINNIEQLSMPMQIRLNRVFVAKEFYYESSTEIHKTNVRIIAASLHDLSDERFKDSFSQELLNHLMVHSIILPPLRERKDDVKLIAEHFLQTAIQRTGKKIQGFSQRFLELLEQYDFPGNLQELSDIIATSVIREESEIIDIYSLSPYIRDEMLKVNKELKGFKPRTLLDIQQEHVRNMLKFYNGDEQVAANELDISLEELHKFLDE